MVREGSTEEESTGRPTITLATGAVVDAAQAAGAWDDMRLLLAGAPAEFRTLLAMAQGRPAAADPSHFRELRVGRWLEQGRDDVRPVVREVLLNSYADTAEGPVIAPLRLRDEAERPVAEAALAADQEEEGVFWARLMRLAGKGKGRSVE